MRIGAADKTPKKAGRASSSPTLRRAPFMHTRALAVTVADDGSLPTEFRLFVKGWNDTENGRYLFDDQAARETMSAMAAWDVDLMIDLEHQALEPGIPIEPTARDARGWCNLELRPDGSLWAVNVRWCDDGAQRLREKRQRYVSPAFSVDEDNRVVSILNIAITAIPATHGTPALVAARALARKPAARIAALGGSMNQKTTAAALDAVANKDQKAALLVLQQILSELLGATGGDADPASDPDPSADPASDPASAGAGGGGDGGDDPKKQLAAAARVASILTGIADPGLAMAELSRRNTVAVELEGREAKLSKDRESIESNERRGLVAQLVKCGVEIPATAWSDDKGTVPVERLAKEPIDALRDRVKIILASKGMKPDGSGGAGALPKIPAPPAGGAEVHGLDARELALCKEYGCEPVMFAKLKSDRNRAPAKTGEGV